MYTPIAGTRVLGLVGAARAGKDTLAQAVLRAVPGAERFAFSDAVAAYARATFEMGRRDPRILQDIGMRLRRQRDSVWLDALYYAIEDRRPPLAVVTGIRFEDEAQMVRQMGGALVRVVRLEPDGRRYVSPDRDPDHPAEREIDRIGCDYDVLAVSGDFAKFDRMAATLSEIMGCFSDSSDVPVAS